MKNFKSGFLLLCSSVKHNIYTLFKRLKQFSRCFYCSIFDVPFCYLVEKTIHVFSEQVKNCLFLKNFDMFVEQTKAIMYRKWNMALPANLIWTCGQHVLFHNILVVFYIVRAHKSK